MDDMSRLGLVHVMILGRGGGSLEDLWAFNEECLARAVHRSKIPIISAVGHETDWTICDFTADLRAPTPSAAAELAIASTDELHGQMEALRHRLRLVMEACLRSLEVRLESLRRSLHDPSTMVGHLSQRVDDLTERLRQGMAHDLKRRNEQYYRLNQSLSFNNPMQTVADARQHLRLLLSEAEHVLAARLESLKHTFTGNAARLEVLSPLSTLSRGYSITARVADGLVVTDAEQLAVGDRLRLRFQHGMAISRVESVEEAKT